VFQYLKPSFPTTTIMKYAALLGLLPAAAVFAHAQEAPAAPAAGQDDLAASDSSRSYDYGHEYG